MASPIILYTMFFLFLLPYFAIAQNKGTIAVDETLTAGAEASSWLSPARDFSFGFRQLEQSKDLFLLSIFYNKIPERTVVWYPPNGNDDPNPAVPRGSQVKLTADQGLVLSDPQGKQIWSSGINPGAVSYGLMNDTGNFVIQSNSSGKLWDSFSDPRDTLLPSQMMEIGEILYSRKSETNFSRGRFQFRLLEGGDVVLNTANVPTNIAYENYYSSGTNGPADSLERGYQVQFNESGYMYILRRNGRRFDLTTGRIVPASDFYYRATLNFDGVFVQYSHPKTGNGNWSAVWSKPDDICRRINGNFSSGACGYNSICSLNGGRPTCRCPEGYSLLDKSDEYGSCKPDFELSCNEEGQGYNRYLYDFKELRNTDWPMSDYELYRPYDEVQCRDSCLNDCFCAVAIFRGESCWKKRLPLSNGREVSSDDGKAFLKYRKVDAPSLFPRQPNPLGDKEKNDRTPVTLSVLLGSSVFVNFVLVTASGLALFFIYRKKLIRAPPTESVMDSNLRCFSYIELAEATNNFNEEVGRGSFGVVYKGAIQTSANNIIVAVKKLDRILQDGEREFKNEVTAIGQTHHKNLVRLLGFCEEGQQRLLVYEFLNNGTLASFLFENSSKPSGSLRTQITYGVAKGILYLHEECSTQIIHCDIKPQNILLDDYYNARVSDFGLAKLLALNQSQTKTAIRGTKGYVAPDWFRNTAITTKVDVYSFGVLLLEIISCRKIFYIEMGEEKAILTDWAYDCYRSGRLDALVEDDMEAMNDTDRLEKFVKVAIWCIQEDPSLRPTMRKVSQMLEGVVEVVVPPNPSPYGSSMS